MPRSPDKRIDKAFELYKKGMKLVEIASQLNIPEGTVRSWKNRYKWDSKSNATLQKGERNVANKKKLSPKQGKKELKQLDLDKAELTEKQRLFCLYYIKNFNATQAAIKAGYSPDSAYQIGYENLMKPQIKTEITRLKELKRQSIMINEDDIVERYMRIAFADMTDFVEFGRALVPVMGPFGPIVVKNPVTKKKETLMKEINDVRFKDHMIVDGGLICQIKQGKDGASIKLEDRQKALDWLANFFEMNPMDKHKKEYDKRKLEIELLKAEVQLNKADGNAGNNEPADDGFIDALNACTEGTWDDVERD
jgi:phage terminase small subunit